MLPLKINTNIGGVTCVGRMSLFSAFSEGRQVAFYDQDNRMLSGTIAGITLESGFTPPATPRHFIVHINGGGSTHQVYVRTID